MNYSLIYFINLALILSSCGSINKRQISSVESPDESNQTFSSELSTIDINQEPLLGTDLKKVEEISESPASAPVVIDSKIEEQKLMTKNSSISRKIEVDQKLDYSRHFLSHPIDEKVKFWLHYFSVKDRARFIRFVNNGVNYQNWIFKILNHYQLPKELYFVGLIESGYYLGAHSKAKAVGPWQFIGSTAKRYHLKVNHVIDERRNIIKATTAAALYFKDLFTIFGSWDLALAAYNSGEYGLISRIRRAGKKDYYHLAQYGYLPKETANYVPKVLAVLLIHKNPKKFGFAPSLFSQNSSMPQNLSYQKIAGPISLQEIGNRYGHSYHIVQKLNSEYLKGHIPKSNKNMYVLLPQQSKNNPSADLGQTLKKKTAISNHVLKLKQKVNNPKAHFAFSKKSLPKGQKIYYQVKKNDTWLKIGTKLKLSQSALKKNMNGRWKKLYAGKQILIVKN
jgi:membrane-bound lytic murein transglycosylase D